MQEYSIKIKQTLLQMVALGFFIMVMAYAFGYSSRIPGLIMGNITSMIYFLLMCYRVHKSADMPIHKALSYMRVGWGIRLSFVVLMLLISIKIPVFDFFSAVIGLFTLQMVMFLNGVFIIASSFLRYK